MNVFQNIQRLKPFACHRNGAVGVQSWCRPSSALTWRSESTRSYPSMQRLRAGSQSVCSHALRGPRKSSRSCGADFQMLRPAFRTRLKESSHSRRSMAKMSASSACIHRSMGQRLHSQTTGVSYKQQNIGFSYKNHLSIIM